MASVSTGEFLCEDIMIDREHLSDLYGELVFLDPPEMFDDCIVGISQNSVGHTFVAYSYGKIIEKLKEDMSEEEAIEYFDYNIIGSYVGDHSPCFIYEI